MITLISALLGFLAAATPEIVKLFRERTDRAHEKEMLRLQAELARQEHAVKLEAIGLETEFSALRAAYDVSARATAPVGIRWVDGLNASVRPVVTYCFFGLFALTVGAALAGRALPPGVWTDDVQALFGGVIGFWFLNRSFLHARGR
jgi:hypothetical protein